MEKAGTKPDTCRIKVAATGDPRPEGEPGSTIDEIDLLKAVAIIAVLVIHAAGWMVPSTTPPLQGSLATVVAVARFSVPAFVLASGFCLYRRYWGRPTQVGAFLRRRWSRVLVPWVVWAPVFLGLQLLGGRLHLDTTATTWIISGAGHLYFLILIAQLYLLMLVMPKGKGLLVVTVAALLAQLALSWLRTNRPVLHTPLDFVYTNAAYEAAPFWIGYFTAGCLIGQNYERLRRLKRWWPLGLLACIAAAGIMSWQGNIVPGSWTQGTYSYLWPSRLLMVGAIAVTVLWCGAFLGPRWRGALSLIRSLSHNSLGIYVLSPIALLILGHDTSGWPKTMRLLVLVAGQLAFAFPLAIAFASTRLGAWAVGSPRRESEVAGQKPEDGALVAWPIRVIPTHVARFRDEEELLWPAGGVVDIHALHGRHERIGAANDRE
jgi:surface polysaccharide O-acyltransferase-like enzyme